MTKSPPVLSLRERPGHDRGDRDAVEHEARAVVDQALALDDRHELARHAQPARDRRRRDRVGGRDDRAEHEGARPGQPSISAWATTATPTVVTTTSPTASIPIGRGVRPQVAKRGEEGRSVEERRQDPEEDQLGPSSNVGIPGTTLIASPPSTSRIGYGTRSAGASASNVATADEQAERDDAVLHLEVHGQSCRSRGALRR